MQGLTWTCHVCGENRPDNKIAVFKKPLVIKGNVVGSQNIRYCIDRPECREGVKTITFVKAT